MIKPPKLFLDETTNFSALMWQSFISEIHFFKRETWFKFLLLKMQSGILIHSRAIIFPRKLFSHQNYAFAVLFRHEISVFKHKRQRKLQLVVREKSKSIFSTCVRSVNHPPNSFNMRHMISCCWILIVFLIKLECVTTDVLLRIICG